MFPAWVEERCLWNKLPRSKFCTIFCQTTSNFKIVLKLKKKKKKNQTALSSLLKGFILTLF